MTKESLLPRVAHGDAVAMRACVERYGPLVFGLALRMLGSRAEAEDAVQEAFVALWRSAARFDPTRGTEETFVAMVARRRIIDRKRSLGRRPTEQAAIEETPSKAPEPEATLDGRRAAVALGELPEERRQIVRLAVLEGLSHSEIAEATGMPLGTVKSHFRRGLEAIRRALLGVAKDEERSAL